MSNSVRPHRRQPTRLRRPWDSPGKNTGVGCHFLLQCMKVKSESEVAQSCLTLRDPMDCSLPGSSIHGIFQGRVLEWVTIAFSMSQTSESNGSWPQGIQSRPVVTYTCSRVRCVFQRPPQITYPQLHLLLFTYLLPFSFHSFNRIHLWSSYHAGSQMGLPHGSQLLLLLAPGLWSWSTANGNRPFSIQQRALQSGEDCPGCSTSEET